MPTAMPGIPSAKPMDQSSGGLKFIEPQTQQQPQQQAEPQPEIVIVDPAAPAPAPVQPQGDDAAAGIAALKAQIAERDSLLQRQTSELESAHRMRVEAENKARVAAREVDTTRSAATDAEHTAILTGLTSAQAELSGLESQFAKLMGEGKFDEAAGIQGKIGRVGARLEALEQGKAAIEQAKKNPPQQQQPVQDEFQQREAFLAAQHPANAAWIRQQGTRFFTDPVFREKASAASQYANKVLGFAIGSAEYFQHVEEATGQRAKAAPAPQQAAQIPGVPGPNVTAAEPLSQAAAPVAQPQAQPQPRPVTYAAPPSRSAPPTNANGGSPGRLEVTPEEVKFCDDNELDLRSYVKNREQLKREGKWGTGR